ncbi:MAG TPA: hypothetical protein VFC39_20370 [Acidobacteriaceae bacterium]|nr:hypothetical protein [Acidobacteriaceae bacterium]
MLKRSVRYFTLALTLVALTATVRTAHAQSTGPCTDPSNPCVVTGTDPQPTGDVVTGTDPQPTGGDSTDDSQSMDDLISYLIIVYGLA